ncbi:MAG: hypothetical protein CK550_03980 [Gemmatimonadetes bacterium]|nr:MAG: hypothetical protein CK550_03980 [Gemmatimonadota bacterium]
MFNPVYKGHAMPLRRSAAGLAACWLAGAGPLAATAAHAQLGPATPAAVARFGSAYDGDLSHWQYETFHARWVHRQNGEGSITFKPDGNGRIAALQLLGHTFTRIAPAR